MDEMICLCYGAEGELLGRVVPVSFRLQRDEDAPADSLEVEVPGSLPPLCTVELRAGNERWFAGVVDEQNETADPNGRRTELVCRSFEAVLMDNQAVAGTVRHPSRRAMEHWQLRPLGIGCTGGQAQVFGGEYTVPFGADVYTALQRFGQLYFGSGALWMEDRHTLHFGEREPVRHVLPKVTAVTLCRRPVERISDVVMQNPLSGVYDAVLGNRAAKKAGVLRRRFLRAGDNRGAEKLAAGEKAAFALVLTVPGGVNVRPGDRVDAVLRPLGCRDAEGAKVVSLRCSGTSAGVVTRLETEAEEISLR